MDLHIKQFFHESSNEESPGNFHKVIALHEKPEISWFEVVQMVPNICKGWFELSKLSVADRIEFLRDFWLNKIPYHPEMPEFIMNFFSTLDDVEIFIIQRKYDDPFEARLVYSLKDNRGFFHGAVGASDEELVVLQSLFPEIILPEDYMAFLKIHNGFSKATDTGILKSTVVEETRNRFKLLIEQGGPLFTPSGQLVDPNTLIPFYESFGMPVFQCFWSEWYPEQEMGNIYYSGITKSISDIHGVDLGTENMAFATFSDWLMFYLENIDEEIRKK
jgi:hypothetical protein